MDQSTCPNFWGSTYKPPSSVLSHPFKNRHKLQNDLVKKSALPKLDWVLTSKVFRESFQQKNHQKIAYEFVSYNRNEKLINLKRWLDQNKLSLNVWWKQKSCSLEILNVKQKSKKVSEIRFLGVLIEQKLSWKQHI